MKLTKMYPNWFKSLKKEENSPESHENMYKDAMEMSFHNPIHGGDPWGMGNDFGTYTSRQETPTGAIYTYPGGVTSEHKKDMTPIDHIRRARNHWNQVETSSYKAKQRRALSSTGQKILGHETAATHHFAEAGRKAFYNSYGLDHKVSPDEAESWKPAELEPVSKEKFSDLFPGAQGQGVVYTYGGSNRLSGRPLYSTFYHYLDKDNKPMNLRQLFNVHHFSAKEIKLKAQKAFDHYTDDQNLLGQLTWDPKKYETVLGLLGASRTHQEAANMIRKVIEEEQGHDIEYKKPLNDYTRSKERIIFQKHFGYELPEN